MYRLVIPEKGQKGVLVFKHLEQGLLENLNKTKALSLIRERYYIGLYFGGSVAFTISEDLVDFFIAKKNVISNEHIITKPILRYTGSSFIPSKVKSFRNIEKKLDFVGIFNRAVHKRPEDFIEISKLLHQKNDNFKIKLITYGKSNLNRSFLNYKYNHENFVHEDYEINDGMFPFSESDLYRLISSAKAFILPSKSEGSSRLTFESCLLGVPVIYNQDLKGGTICEDLLNSGMVYSYKKLSDVPLIKINKTSKEQIEMLENKFLEENSRASFLLELKSLPFNISSKFNLPENKSLSKLIPSHANIISENYTNSMDDQFVHALKLIDFLESEDNYNYGGFNGKLLLLDKIQNIKMFITKIKKSLAKYKTNN